MIDDAKELVRECKEGCSLFPSGCVLEQQSVNCSECTKADEPCHPSPHGYICMAFVCKKRVT